MPFTEQDRKRQMTLVSEIESQSDRGVAIIGASWVEEALRVAIKSKLECDDEAVWNKLFENSGPLSSFSAKIDIARLLGIFDRDVYSGLHAIRKIRNEFAHAITGKDLGAITFATPHISDRCPSLKIVAGEKHSNPRTAFIRACAVLNSDLYIYALTQLEPVTARNRVNG